MKIHIVQQGDTLWKLAEAYGVDFEKLKQANSHLEDPDQLKVGMKIKIPTDDAHSKKPKGGGGVKPPKEKPKQPVKSEKEQPMKPPKAEKEKPVKPAPPSKPIEKDDTQLLKELLKKIAPYVIAKLLKDEHPEVINQIKIELVNQNQMQQSVQPMPYLPQYYTPPVQKPPVKPYVAPPKAKYYPHKPCAQSEQMMPKSPCHKKEAPKSKMAPPSPPQQHWSHCPPHPYSPHGHMHSPVSPWSAGGQGYAPYGGHGHKPYGYGGAPGNDGHMQMSYRPWPSQYGPQAFYGSVASPHIDTTLPPQEWDAFPYESYHQRGEDPSDQED